MQPCPLYIPDENKLKKSAMFGFLQEVSKTHSNITTYAQLHHWSITQKEEFWKKLMEFYPIEMQGQVDPVLKPAGGFLDYPWFPKLKLNFAQNLLRCKEDQKVALNFVHETGLQNKMTYGQLKQEVASLQDYLKDHLHPGDVLACFMPNIAQTVTSMLACTALGGVFTSTSSDFGVEGVVDRFGQSKPKVLVTVSGYTYNGKYFDLTEKINQIISKIPEIKKVIVVDFLGKSSSLPGQAVWYHDAIKNKGELHFVTRKFNDPLYIMYSSGTTGVPKCIIHSIGGTLLQHIKELGLHCDLNQNKNIFYFTTCGWMMWNWLVSSLYFGAQVTLYEGSPAYPSMAEFVKMVDQQKVNIFGTSPKFLRALELNNEVYTSSFDHLETILSTGAPLNPEQFDFVYDYFKKDIQLSSICGGTDILGCFMLGNPILPVFKGEIQCLGLGMEVAAFDEQGRSVSEQEGELVCLGTFPSQPIGFLNDPGQEKFKQAYFSHYPGVWRHGDFITITGHGGVRVYGRSDATLNPGGVRIGTAEIYRQTEKIEELDDSLCIGHQKNGEVEIVLFVTLVEGKSLTDEIKGKIKTIIKKETTPRHVPKEIIQVSAIPYTRSGKKMELAVSKIIAGKELTNIEAVANPECLKEYEHIRLDHFS